MDVPECYLWSIIHRSAYYCPQFPKRSSVSDVAPPARIGARFDAFSTPVTKGNVVVVLIIQ